MYLDIIIETLATIVVSVIASSGFWLWLGNRYQRKSIETELIMGLAHEKIKQLGMRYINRGFITQEEYEDLHDYLYKPYEKLGGNGSAKRTMMLIDKLPYKSKQFEENKPNEFQKELDHVRIDA